MNIDQHTTIVKNTAQSLGFEYCGIAKADFLEDDARHLEKWLQKGYQGTMSYMERNFDKRVDPRKLVEGAQSVITLIYNYFPEQQQSPELPKIAKYAYGKDYHDVIREKLNHFLEILRTEIGAITGRGFVDSAPVLERAWAQKSGVGWIGKNGNLITKHSGSFYFIASLIVDLKLNYDDPFSKDYCGSCTRCIDACPTEAIISPTIIDAQKCISYLTIELKDELISNDFKGKMDGWMFGCDVCQDVCPWNRFSKPHNEPAFEPTDALFSFQINDWQALDIPTFNSLLKDSPIKRTKLKGIQRNLKMLM